MLKNKVRIIGGKWRGRSIQFEPQAALRPTPDRVRETLFNWLGPRLQGARCLDLFAGSAVLGFEALSRGASFVQSVERDAAVARCVLKESQKLGLEDAQFNLAQTDGLTWLSRYAGTGHASPEAYQIIFVDPPYNSDLLEKSLALIQNQAVLEAGGLLYLESNRDVEDLIQPNFYRILKQKKAGQVHYYLLENHATGGVLS